MSSDYTTQICKKCGHEFPLTSDFWHIHTKGKFRSWCKDCERSRVRQWSKNNPDKVKARNQRIDKQERKEYVANWKKNNPDRHHAQLKRHAERHPEVYMKSKHKHRAKEVGSEGVFTEQEVNELYVKQNGRCFHCATELNGIYHRDHWIPLSKGGSNWISNIRLLCPHCNLSKNNRLPSKWHPEKYDDNQMPM